MAAAWAADPRTLVRDSKVKLSLDGQCVLPEMEFQPDMPPLHLLITVGSPGCLTKENTDLIVGNG